jgi:hypothetical protein
VVLALGSTSIEEYVAHGVASAFARQPFFVIVWAAKAANWGSHTLVIVASHAQHVSFNGQVALPIATVFPSRWAS